MKEEIKETSRGPSSPRYGCSKDSDEVVARIISIVNKHFVEMTDREHEVVQVKIQREIKNLIKKERTK